MSVPKTETIVRHVTPAVLTIKANEIEERPTGSTILYPDEATPVVRAAQDAVDAMRAAADALAAYHDAFREARCMR